MSLLIKNKPKRFKFKHKALIVFILIGALVFLWQKVSSPQYSQPVKASPAKSAITVKPNWPKNATAAAIGLKGEGILAKTGDEKPLPIASVAKVITALALLEKHPIKTDEEGPQIPITAKDEQLWRDYAAQNGTVVLIKEGVPISLYDALEAMLMTSANNVADTAAIWGFGSLDEYHKYARDMLKRYGLNDTTVGGDASGLSPKTKSTPSDLIQLGERALDNPVIAKIVTQHSAEFPFAGTIPLYNGLVTKHGFNGIKPGSSDEAKSTSLFSKQQKINGKKVTVLGAILGSPSSGELNQDAVNMVYSIQTDLKKQLK